MNVAHVFTHKAIIHHRRAVTPAIGKSASIKKERNENDGIPGRSNHRTGLDDREDARERCLRISSRAHQILHFVLLLVVVVE